MAETRLEKYKKYRESLNEVKENSKDKDVQEASRSRVVSDNFNTTSTLPIDEVLGEIDDDSEDTTVKILTIKKIKIGLFVISGILILAALCIFAIIAFGGKN